MAGSLNDISRLLVKTLSELYTVEMGRVIDGQEKWIELLPVDKQAAAKAEIVRVRAVFENGGVSVELIDGEVE